MLNKVIKSFQDKHYHAKTQWRKDLLLISTVSLCILIRVLQGLFVLIAFPFVLLYIGVLECIKQLGLGIAAWPIAVWDCIEHVWPYAKELRHIRNPVLPANVGRND